MVTVHDVTDQQDNFTSKKRNNEYVIMHSNYYNYVEKMMNRTEQLIQEMTDKKDPKSEEEWNNNDIKDDENFGKLHKKQEKIEQINVLFQAKKQLFQYFKWNFFT